MEDAACEKVERTAHNDQHPIQVGFLTFLPAICGGHIVTHRDTEVKAVKAQTVRRQIDGALLYGKVLSLGLS